MLEKRKDESESMGKYQAMLMSGIIAAVIVFLAPTLIVVITGVHLGEDQTAEQALFAPPKTDFKCVAEETGDDADNSDAIPYNANNPNHIKCAATGEKLVATDVLPGNFAGRIAGLFDLLLWVVRIVIVMMIIVAVIMLHVHPKR